MTRGKRRAQWLQRYWPQWERWIHRQPTKEKQIELIDSLIADLERITEERDEETTEVEA